MDCINRAKIILKGVNMTNQTNCNHRTPYKPQVEYYDEQTVIINGVQYQRVEEQKPQTLYEALHKVYYGTTYVHKDEICDSVERWLPDELEYEENEMGYNQGWNDCLNEIKRNLR